MVHVVVPEGLGRGPEGGLVLSAHFQAVVDRVARRASAGDTVYMSPGNPFGGETPEHLLAAAALSAARPDLDVQAPDTSHLGRYLDTLDNARVLRIWLQDRGAWPLPPIRLYCCGPHASRSWLTFRLEGYVVARLEAVSAAARSPRPVSRLFYMQMPLVHGLYEMGAIAYDLLRWGWLKVRGDA